MKIEFSKHAKEQIKRRKISKKSIIETINTGKHKGSFKNRQTHQKHIGNKILEVVTIEEANKLIIITAYYLYEN